MKGVTANEGRLGEVLLTIYSGYLENAGRDPNIARELYKQGLMKPVGLRATSYRTALEGS